MKITIITATFNSIKHIADVLDCMKQQTYQNIEYVIIDGGSTDGTLEYLKKDNQVFKLVSEPDKGIYDALNKGIRMATGDIIGFLHSDDMLSSPHSIQNIITAFSDSKSLSLNNISNKTKQEQVDVLYGDLIYVSKDNPSKIIRYWRSFQFRTILLNWGWMPAHPAVFMRREVYEKHGLFDLQFKISADYDLMLRIFKDKSLNFVYLPEVITKMRIGGVSNRSVKNMIQKSKEDYRAICKNNIPYPLWVLFIKNVSKIPQFFRKH